MPWCCELVKTACCSSEVGNTYRHQTRNLSQQTCDSNLRLGHAAREQAPSFQPLTIELQSSSLLYLNQWLWRPHSLVSASGWSLEKRWRWVQVETTQHLSSGHCWVTNLALGLYLVQLYREQVVSVAFCSHPKKDSCLLSALRRVLIWQIRDNISQSLVLPTRDGWRQNQRRMRGEPFSSS